MKEEFLHYLWKFKKIDTTQLKTTTGLNITIFDFGELNNDAGPDFFNAKIKIGKTLWAGNIEIHVKASEWIAHKHSGNPAYNNVVLHVVYECDTEIYRSDGSIIPCLELKNRIDSSLFSKYGELISSLKQLPCQDSLDICSDITKVSWLHNLAVKRLERKSIELMKIVKSCNYDWEEAMYISLARSFGLGVNNDAMEQLARSLPLKYIKHHRDNLMQIEALLFGQAGLLPLCPTDGYSKKLKAEYKFLKNKFNLLSNNGAAWKFFRLRPANFPTIRIAQLCAVLYNETALLSKIISLNDYKEIQKLFRFKSSSYWNTHYTFEKETKKISKTMGSLALKVILTNCVVPFLFVYGKNNSQDNCIDKAINILETLPPEKNKIILMWQQNNISVVNTLETQGLIELTKTFCFHKKCLSCNFGVEILKNNNKNLL